jgi:microcystin-dependent protein
MHFSTLLISSLLVVFPAWAQSVPLLMNYQGRLTDEVAQPLPNGTYAVQFRLWNRALTNQPGGTLVWGRQYDLTLVNGVFNVILGAAGGLALPGAAVNDLQFAFGDAERYLGLTLVRLHDGTVISEAQRKEILPRQQLLSAPFAIEAGRAASLVTPYANTLCPPGTIVAFGGASVPPGWRLCDGQALKSLEFAALFLAIGSAWGNGTDDSDSATDFNLPDLRGVFLRGVNGNRGDNYADPGDDRNNLKSGGNSNHVGSYQRDQFRQHSHPTNRGKPPGTSDGFLEDITFNSTVGNSTGAAGGTETRPKNAAVNYIIKY